VGRAIFVNAMTSDPVCGMEGSSHSGEAVARLLVLDQCSSEGRRSKGTLPVLAQERKSSANSCCSHSVGGICDFRAG
jgi:hypothetical protein